MSRAICFPRPSIACICPGAIMAEQKLCQGARAFVLRPKTPSREIQIFIPGEECKLVSEARPIKSACSCQRKTLPLQFKFGTSRADTRSCVTLRSLVSRLRIKPPHPIHESHQTRGQRGGQVTSKERGRTIDTTRYDQMFPPESLIDCHAGHLFRG